MRIRIGNNKIFKDVVNKLFPKITINEINGFSIDSRKVKENDIYLAIQGANHDGHNYISEAISKGACLIFSEKPCNNPSQNIINVQSTLDLLKILAKEYVKQFKCLIIAITGSNGKTTTKELLAHVLCKTKKIMFTKGNYNSTIGLPMSIFSIVGNEEFCILEMGASRPGEITELCKIVKPDIGLITNISGAHVENFGSVKSIAKTKSALFKNLRSNGTAFYNLNDKYIPEFSTDAEKITYGFDVKADYEGFYSKQIVKINNIKISIPYPSEIMAKNILAVFAIAKFIGISTNQIKNSINTFETPAGRSEIITHGNLTIINDSYNANLDSSKAGIDILKNYKGNKKIVVIGDMLELGDLSYDYHYELGRYISNAKIDLLLAFGKFSKITVEACEGVVAKFFYNKQDLIERLNKIVHDGDVIYIKGSRGMKMDDIIKKGIIV